MAKDLCPVWVGYLLASPLRKLIQNPDTMLDPYIKQGMQVLDLGCAMGFFSLAMARMVGQGGRVYCVDLQEKMVQVLKKRAQKKQLIDRMDIRQCSPESLNIEDLQGRIDFALASAVVHEVPDPASFFHHVSQAVKIQGKLLLVEPKGHVTTTEFDETISLARDHGFKLLETPKISMSRTALLEKI
ncbi:MAG: class I SAM-dependent methyltransferase [Sedimentisphaerales bacterium]|nr:class I SAM-dependent methyltransferase [Sedimentisphaerales bacterium]